MDPAIQSAAQLLAMGDPLAALNHVALREDPRARSLRGIALAQIGDLSTARGLIRQAALDFGEANPKEQARCIAAEGEIALVQRDLSYSRKALEFAIGTLRENEDLLNAQYAQFQLARWHVLIGRTESASDTLRKAPSSFPSPLLQASYHLIRAELAMRERKAKEATHHSEQALHVARNAGMHTLAAEAEQLMTKLSLPAARIHREQTLEPLTLAEVEPLLGQDLFIIDACRRTLRCSRKSLSFSKRPVLFSLLQSLGIQTNESVARETLIQAAFESPHADDSLRARLRVEIGRLRRLIAPFGQIEATDSGFALNIPVHTKAVVLLPPSDGPIGAITALLSDGKAWPTSSLALALNQSQRSTQRHLVHLEEQGAVHSIGRGRNQRWLSAPLTGIATTMLLPSLEASS